LAQHLNCLRALIDILVFDLKQSLNESFIVRGLGQFLNHRSRLQLGDLVGQDVGINARQLPRFRNGTVKEIQTVERAGT